MLLEQIYQLIETPFLGGEIEVTNFQIDSRLCSFGSLFFALRGEKDDGHRWLQKATEQGAVVAVVEKGYDGEDYGLHLIYVEDVLKTLHKMGKNRVNELKSPYIIGITGSAGKTTTKEFLATLVGKSFKVGKSPKSYNSQRTFPLNLLNFSGDEELLILEMGMSYVGEMDRLLDIATPDLAIITSLSAAHVGNFQNGFKDIVVQKSKIFSRKKTKTLICTSSVKQLLGDKRTCDKEVLVTSEEGGGSLIRKEREVYIKEGKKDPILIPTHLSESHLLEDLLLAVCAARRLNVSWKNILERISLIKTFENRFEKVVIDGVLYLNDTYNASEDSVLLALKNLPMPEKNRKTICVLGEMGEMGSYLEKAYISVAEAALKKADHLICHGEGTKPLQVVFQTHDKSYDVISNKEKIADFLKRNAQKGDVVLIKGKNTQKLWEIFSYLQKK